MKAVFAKWWPSLVHLAAVGVLFISPSVDHYAAAHPGSSAIIGAGWGWLLHWAQSPKQSPASKF